MSREVKVTFIILFVLVLLSLGLNGLLLWQWWSFKGQVEETALLLGPAFREAISQSITDLEKFEGSTIQFDVAIEQDLPVQAEIPFQETLEVPIQTTIPIEQEFTTTVSLFGLPTDVIVPIDMEVPIDLTVPVSFDRTVPVSTTVPLDMEVPIAIVVNETELGPYLGRIRTSLAFLEETLAGLEETYGSGPAASD